jgi:hypothetical protein
MSNATNKLVGSADDVETPSKPKNVNQEIIDEVGDTIKTVDDQVFADFDEIFSKEIDAEPIYKQFKFQGRIWKALPTIGVGSMRKLVRAEKRGDAFATIAFLTTIVVDEDGAWEEIVDRLDPARAGAIVAALLKQYGGDNTEGK